MSASWKKILAQSLTSARDVALALNLDGEPLERVTQTYPAKINPYFLDLVKTHGAPLARQVVPDPRELRDTVGVSDPLGEEASSPVPNLTHRYPDRVLLLVSDECAVHCRFCTRKRKAGRGAFIRPGDVEAGIDYIGQHAEIRDVLLSGGDPLLLSNERLEEILSRIRAIPHVNIIRIGTRLPSVLPRRIDDDLVALLRRFHPLFVNVHFNHPLELTREAAQACSLLADAGIPLANQTVLLRGINDRAETLAALFHGLLAMRVRPYYLHQGDLTRGTDHFRTPVQAGIEIMRRLRGHISGMAVPTLVVDLPGGGGKVPLLPDYVKSIDGKCWKINNFRGDVHTYPDPEYSD